MTEISGI